MEDTGMVTRHRSICALFAVILIAAMPLTLSGQQLREQLFADADQVMAAAKEAHADLLAPKNFEKAFDLTRRLKGSSRRKRASMI